MEGAKLLEEDNVFDTPHIRFAEVARQAIEEGCNDRDCLNEYRVAGQMRLVIGVGTSYILVNKEGRIGFEEQEIPGAVITSIDCSICGMNLYFDENPSARSDDTLVEWKPVGFGELA